MTDDLTASAGEIGGRGVLVHEWIADSGGSERVLEALHEMFPDLDIHCLWKDSADPLWGSGIRETWLARTPLRRSKQLALPLMPLTWRSRPGTHDWAIISSHLFAHHVKFRQSASSLKKLVYVHTPARYIWTPELDRRGNGVTARVASTLLRPLDKSRAREIASAASNSEFVRERVRETWAIDSRVIYPPVDSADITSRRGDHSSLTDDERRTLDDLPEQFVLGASRAVPYKRLDRVVDLSTMTGVPAVIVGDGPELPALKSRALETGSRVMFLGRASTPMLHALYERSFAFVFPPIEDFGIMPVEAMAAGAPVIANHVGGASESVRPDQTGVLIDMDSDSDLRNAIDSIKPEMSVSAIARSADFDKSVFQANILSWVADAI